MYFRNKINTHSIDQLCNDGFVCVCDYYSLDSEISPMVCQNSFMMNLYCIPGTTVQNQSSHRDFQRSSPLFYWPQAKLLPISQDSVLFLFLKNYHIVIWSTSSTAILISIQIILEMQISFTNMKAFTISNNLKDTAFVGLHYHFRLMLHQNLFYNKGSWPNAFDQVFLLQFNKGYTFQVSFLWMAHVWLNKCFFPLINFPLYNHLMFTHVYRYKWLI